MCFVSGVQHGTGPGRPLGQAKGSVQQNRRKASRFLIRDDIETGTQNLHIGSESPDDKRMILVVFHFEHRLSREFHHTLMTPENDRIFETGTRVEPNPRTVRQRDIHPLSRRNVQRRILRGKAIDRMQVCQIACTEEQHDRCRHSTQTPYDPREPSPKPHLHGLIAPLC